MRQDIVLDGLTGSAKPTIERRLVILRPALAAAMVGGGYYVGARIGFALTFAPHPVSTLWPPNSILLAGLVLAPYRWWWFLLLAVLPAHFLIQLQSGVPIPMSVCWFIRNSSEAFIGVFCLRYLNKGASALTAFARRQFRFRGFARSLPVILLDAGFVILIDLAAAATGSMACGFVERPGRGHYRSLIIIWARIDSPYFAGYRLGAG